MTPICIERLAAKLQWLRADESHDARQLLRTPGLVEALLLTQAVSRRPGGLLKFANDLLAAFPEWADSLRGDPEETEFIYLVGQVRLGPAEEKRRCAEARRMRELPMAGDELNQHAQRIASVLSDLCQEQSLATRESVPGLLPQVVQFMDLHAKTVAASIADTASRRTIWRELDFARTQGVPRIIVADSRFGKTTDAGAYCQAWPGRARLVTVPDSSQERALYQAHADAFGMDYTPATPTAQLRERVEFVIRQTGLFLVYDEAHFLVPLNYHRTTAPKRLNWVRCQVLDRGVCCAFFATPQTYQQTLANFVKVTGHNMDQWLGRMPQPLVLPCEMSREDLLAVGRHHFPELPEQALKLICAKAGASEGYLKSLEFVAKRAQFIAREAGRPRVTIADVDQAAADMLGEPAPAAEPLPASRQRSARLAQTACEELPLPPRTARRELVHAPESGALVAA